jgi:hypothetical protein
LVRDEVVDRVGWMVEGCEWMDRQAIRQDARRAAMEAEASRRTERVSKERRITDLAILVLTATGQRDAAVDEAELRAGQALLAMTRTEGLTLREAVGWLAGRVSIAEAARLRRLASAATQPASASPPISAGTRHHRGDSD